MFASRGVFFSRSWPLVMALVCLWAGVAFGQDQCVRSAELVKKALDQGEGSDAEVELYKEAQALCPKMAEARFNLGLAYQKRAQLDDAERELREAVRLKDEEPFRVGLAGVLLQKGEVSAAREQYELARERNPKSVAALQGLAVILEKQNKLSDAVDVLEKAAEIDGSNGVTFYNLGVLREKLRQPDSALAAYKRAAEVDPKSFDAHYMLGTMQSRLGHYHEAKVSLQRAAELRANDVRAHLGLAEVFDKLGDREMAESSLRRVVAIAPTNIVAQVNLGIVLIEERRYQEALRVLERAAQSDGNNNPRVWSALGRAQLELGKMAEAEKNLKLALSQDSSNPFAHNNLGVLFQRMGRTDEAREEFKLALSLNPELEVARRNLESLGGE
ncbi:MAG: tetratricopeptide repeat protein [Pseudomonadota bacterium]